MSAFAILGLGFRDTRLNTPDPPPKKRVVGDNAQTEVVPGVAIDISTEVKIPYITWDVDAATDTVSDNGAN